jgi:hypothetical protein
MRIIIRDCEESDHSFIYKTYLTNRWFDKANRTTLKKDSWMSLQHKRLETILTNDVVIVACLSDDPDTIVGFALMDGLVPWTYVKLAWRSPGLKVQDKLMEKLQ